MVRERLGQLSFAAGDFAEARRLGEESLVLFQELGDIVGVAEQENFLGDLALRQGDYELRAPITLPACSASRAGRVSSGS